MATREGAARMNGKIREDTGMEIEESDLEAGEEWTSRDFTPKPKSGSENLLSTKGLIA